ncbi:hypothetical protein OsI_39083 [Oryza sativa Indica Group]|uniref:Protein kinase domain-containing protein n=2 Tax=Oryza TaxID=4527 RepID=B8BMZ1_ORYSI|nr:hypothetical protein OsI_39083 [Oryza sativa Indica Group]
MASPPTPQPPPPVDVDLGKLSYEIFSLLESNFLFGAGGGGGGGVCSLPGTPGRALLGGKVRVLAIDGCGPGPGDALLAAAALVRLETALREKSGDGDARVADFFDAAAGAGAGGVLAAMLFLKGADGRPRYTAADALAFVAASLGKGGLQASSLSAGELTDLQVCCKNFIALVSTEYFNSSGESFSWKPFSGKGKLRNGQKVAIKVLSSESRQGTREFLNELSVISNINHHNLVKLHGCCVEGDQKMLVYNYLENNSLAQSLFGNSHSSIQLDWKTRVKICIGVASGLKYLHEEVRPVIVHRDIKASNILLDKDLSPKISDFGLAKLFPGNMTHISTRVAGTLGYLAPEYAIRGQLTKKADVYSFGVLLLEIVSGRCHTDPRLPLQDQFLLERRSSLRRVFGDATLRDTVAPLLVPCYDLATAAPFLFSRADAVESGSFDFRLRDVCAATCAGGAAATAVHSVDGRTAIAAASGGVAAMGNPTAAAITHVLHNKQEFPLAAGVDDLLVVSIGSGSSSAATPSTAAGWRTPLPSRSPSPAEMVRLTAEGVADMVDQAVAMAFGHTCGRNYVRIQAASPACKTKALSSVDAKKAAAIADGMLTQRNVEAELFRGRRLSEKSNREKLDAFAAELVKEHERRRASPGLPNVVIKQVAAAAAAVTPARLSSATTTSSATATTARTTVSSMPSPAASLDSGRH